MEGRYPAGIMFVLCNSDPKLEEDFNHWYNHTHLGEVGAPGLFVNATRYVNPSAKATAEDPKYLAVYETDRGDPAAAWNENMPIVQEARRKIGGKPHPGLKVAMAGVFKRTGYQYTAPSAHRTSSVLVTLTDTSAVMGDPELQKWHTQVDADLLATSIYWTVTRFVHTAPEAGKPKYLALYESEENAPAAFKRLSEAGSRRPNGNPLNDKAVRYRGFFDLLFSVPREAMRSQGKG